MQFANSHRLFYQNYFIKAYCCQSFSFRFQNYSPLSLCSLILYLENDLIRSLNIYRINKYAQINLSILIIKRNFLKRKKKRLAKGLF